MIAFLSLLFHAQNWFSLTTRRRGDGIIDAYLAEGWIC
jgi:hypothetical protein